MFALDRDQQVATLPTSSMTSQTGIPSTSAQKRKTQIETPSVTTRNSICCLPVAFSLRHKQRPATLRTPSLSSQTEIPSSSAPPPPPLFCQGPYDVFLSFRGTDTRNSFTDHLYTALQQKGIVTFRDDEELRRGESIALNLLKAIEESRYVVVVFSPNYADSAWCLDEIAKVADCMKGMGQKVLPVFYHVDPSEVRRQTGNHFGKAFKKHQRRYKGNPGKLKRWKDALSQVANLSGWHLQDGYETKVIQEIVEKIIRDLNEETSTYEGLVGMDAHMNQILSYLDIGCLDVRIIGIYGMGGVGKSTIAHEVFRRVKPQFEGDCFLENVTEHDAVNLQQQLLLSLLKTNVHVQTTQMGKDIIKKRLRTAKVLLILDNVDHYEQLEVLCDQEWFGPGSRIIITTRDEHLLREADKVYKVNPLTDDEALELFCMKAFKKGQLVGEEFLKLSKEFLIYADGLPLAIKVLGSSVHGADVKVWSSALGRLRKNPPKNIIHVLRHSFDGLEETEKKIFLDIACFFKGGFMDHVISVLQGDDYSPAIDIEVLVKKSMVTLFGRKLEMHDLLQKLGRQIVCQEIGQRSRLWLHSEIIHVLGRRKGASAVQSIFLHSLTGDDVVHSIDNAFSYMDKLRLLKIRNVKLSGSIGYLSNELQYLEWHECPIDSFPSEFQPDKLVEVHLYHSRIKQLWRGNTGWRMLRFIYLSGSSSLMSTPDFTQVPDLEKLDLHDCTSLMEIHPSLGSLKKLLYLNMKNCKSIESLPPFISLESLHTLILSSCSGLKKFPEIGGNMESLLKLHLNGTGIEELPQSIEHLTGLTMLDLNDCKNLLRLPDTIGCLTSLKELHLIRCSKLEVVPENAKGMKCLEKLFIGGTSIRQLSFIVGMKNLQFLGCGHCKHLVSESFKGLASFSSLRELRLCYCNLMDGAFLNDLSSLIFLTWLNLNGNCFVRLPESISQFSKLDTLILSNCRQLELLPKKFPSSLQYVYAENCTSLMDYPNQIIVLTSPGQAVVVNSLDATDSSILERISRWWGFTVEGFRELHSIHKYSDGKQIDDYMLVTDVVYPRQLNEVSGSFITVLAIDKIPEWFGIASNRNSISIQIPQNLSDDNKWRGFVACAIFSVKGHTDLSVIEPDPDFADYSYQVTLETDVVLLEPQMLLEMGKGGSFYGSSSHLLIIFCIYLRAPRMELNESSVVKALFKTTNPSMVVKKCAVRLFYDQDDGWYDRIHLELFPCGDHICLNDADWHSEEFIPQRDFRTPHEQNFELHSRKYRIWDWSDHHRGFFCCFERAEVSKWKPFLPFINEGNSAEVELPLNVFDDDNWLGFALCSWLSLEQNPNISLDSENVMLHCRLHSDVDWNGLFDYKVCLGVPVLNLTLFDYIPRTDVLGKVWRQCKLARINVSLINHPSTLAVTSCALRLVFKEDVEHLVQTLTLAKLP